MNYLKEIQIKNFQSHEKTKIQLCPKITGIIGKSQSGKTAILRLLNFIFSNKPSGFSFHNRYTDSKIVKGKLLFSNNCIITAKKTKKEGLVYGYKLRKNNELLFKKVGAKVPDLISKELNINSINIQSQYDDPFIISSKHGQIAKEINNATGAGNADIWKNKVNELIKKLKIKKEVLLSDIVENKKKIIKESKFQELNKVILKLERISKRRVKEEEKAKEIKEISYKIKQCEKQQSQDWPKYNEIYKLILKIERRKILIKKKQEDIDLLFDYIFKRNFLEKEYQDYRIIAGQYIRKIKKQKICPLCFGKIHKKTIERIKNEIYIDF